ncbi:hypothetical protein HKD37_10G028460 [Glycine soja]
MKILLMIRLGISKKEEAMAVTIASARVRLTWLKELYHCYVESGSCLWVTTTYLLHLVDNTIFVDKSSTHVHVVYLLYLDNLDAFHEYK